MNNIKLFEGLENGLKSYIRTDQYMNGLEDRKRRQEREDKADARAGVLNDRADAEYQHKLDRRPIKEGLEDEQVQRQREHLQKEGFGEALQYAQAGQFRKAVKEFNKYGEGKVRKIVRHPDGQGLLLAEDMEGNEFVIDPEKILASLDSSTATRNAGRLEDARQTNRTALEDAKQANRIELQGVKNKGKKDTNASRTRLYPMGEDMDGNKIYGRYDDVTDQLIPVSQDGAIPLSEAMDMAQREASDKAGWLSTDQTDFGDGGREAWINNRAREIMGGGSQPSVTAPTQNPAARGVTQPAGPSAHGQVIRDQNLINATDAINSGKDPAMVKQRLIDAGYTAEQLAAAGIR